MMSARGTHSQTARPDIHDRRRANWLTYHSLFQPWHSVADDGGLSGGLVLLTTLPALFILLAFQKF